MSNYNSTPPQKDAGGFTWDARKFEGNSRLPASVGRQFLVVNRGHEVSEVARHVGASLAAGGRQVSLNGNYPYQPDTTLPLLVTSKHQAGHELGATILLTRKGQDLFFQLSATTRTRMILLHRLLRFGLFIVLFCMFYGSFWRLTGQADGLLLEYTRKHFPEASLETKELITKSGYQLKDDDGVLSLVREGGKTVTPGLIFVLDPRLYLFHTGGVAAIIVAVIGFLVRLLPGKSFDVVSRLLGWPTSEQFMAFAYAEIASIDVETCRVLYDVFGVHEAEIHGVAG